MNFERQGLEKFGGEWNGMQAYKSVKPPEISLDDAIKTLNSGWKFWRLKLGARLNVCTVIVEDIAKELGVKPPVIFLQSYKNRSECRRIVGHLFTQNDNRYSEKLIINLEYFNAKRMRKNLPHEVRHCLHHAIKRGEIDNKDNIEMNICGDTISLPSELHMKHPWEIDADKYANEYVKRTFKRNLFPKRILILANKFSKRAVSVYDKLAKIRVKNDNTKNLQINQNNVINNCEDVCKDDIRKNL